MQNDKRQCNPWIHCRLRQNYRLTVDLLTSLQKRQRRMSTFTLLIHFRNLLRVWGEGLFLVIAPIISLTVTLQIWNPGRILGPYRLSIYYVLTARLDLDLDLSINWQTYHWEYHAMLEPYSDSEGHMDHPVLSSPNILSKCPETFPYLIPFSTYI